MRKFDLAKIFKDIQDLQIKPSDSFNSIRRKFFDLMRKHGIKQGAKSKNGSTLCNNPEWEACEQMLTQRIVDCYLWEKALNFKTPKDLESY